MYIDLFINRESNHTRIKKQFSCQETKKSNQDLVSVHHNVSTKSPSPLKLKSITHSILNRFETYHFNFDYDQGSLQICTFKNTYGNCCIHPPHYHNLYDSHRPIFEGCIFHWDHIGIGQHCIFQTLLKKKSVNHQNQKINSTESPKKN